ncbi:hypothetical protein FRB93_008451 [Tulasnella sp. JGI-2019a]|nr:hypothetical protein FRB93_008451 [Tulasnella sp. JGI-2019a]
MGELSNPTTYTAPIRNTEICHYFSLVSVVIVIWDWATTFDNEIAYIWRLRRLHMTRKPLYLFLRFFGLAYQIYDLVVKFGVWEAKFHYSFAWPITTYHLLPPSPSSMLSIFSWHIEHCVSTA